MEESPYESAVMCNEALISIKYEFNKPTKPPIKEPKIMPYQKNDHVTFLI